MLILGLNKAVHYSIVILTSLGLSPPSSLSLNVNLSYSILVFYYLSKNKDPMLRSFLHHFRTIFHLSTRLRRTSLSGWYNSSYLKWKLVFKRGLVSEITVSKFSFRNFNDWKVVWCLLVWCYLIKKSSLICEMCFINEILFN